MNQDEHRERQAELLKALGSTHQLWTQALESMNAAVVGWARDVADRLLIASAGDALRFFETMGTAAIGAEVRVVAYTDRARIDLRTTAPHGPTAQTFSCTVRPRRGLTEVETVGNDYWGTGDRWPASLSLRLHYADGTDLTLGDGGRAEDWGAGGRLAAFYPSLLADLDRP